MRLLTNCVRWLLGVGLAAAGVAWSSLAAEEPAAQPLEVSTAAAVSTGPAVAARGILLPGRQVRIRAPLSGTVRETTLRAGARVERETVVAGLQVDDLAAQTAKLEQQTRELDEQSLELDKLFAQGEEIESKLRTGLSQAHAAYCKLACLPPNLARKLYRPRLLPRLRRLAGEMRQKLAEGKQKAWEGINKAEAGLAELAEKRAEGERRRAQLALARERLAEAAKLVDQVAAVARIETPVTGTVDEAPVAAGQAVQAGDLLAVVRVDEQLKAVLWIAPRDLARLREPLTLTATPVGGEFGFSSRPARVGPALDPRTRSYPVVAEVPNPDGKYRSGDDLVGEIRGASENNAVTIPTSAIASTDGSARVWRIDGESRVEAVPVKIHRALREKGLSEVAGLRPGDRVVVDPPSRLRAGSVVRVRRSEP